MPAYYTVRFQYDRATIKPDFLRALYSVMLRAGFTYGGVLAWGCQGDLGLDEVIRWNQVRLDRDFELGLIEDVSNDYRQVLLRHAQYHECRVIIANHSRSIDVIVPEDDIFDIGSPFPAELYASDHEELVVRIRHEQVEPLQGLAIAVWQSGLAVSVQTYGEIGGPTDAKLLNAGESPSMLPFAIVRTGWVGQERLAKRGVRIIPVGETGILLVRMGTPDEPTVVTNRPRK